VAYLLLLAPVVAIALLVTMSSIERWQETEVHGTQLAPVMEPRPAADWSRRHVVTRE
jgi:hypothetical protein